MFLVILKIYFYHVLILLQGGLASAKIFATSCWSSSPFCGNMAMFPTISNAVRTLRQLKRSLLLNRHQRSLPCSTRRRVWWSHRVLGNTLSHHLNSALTCLINKCWGRCGYHKLSSRGHLDLILSAVLQDLRVPGMPSMPGSGGLRAPLSDG